MLIAMYIAALAFTATLGTFIAATTVAFRPETVLSNKVIIYSLSNSLDVTKLAKVINKFLKI
jgi:hypothetical protein